MILIFGYINRIVNLRRIDTVYFLQSFFYSNNKERSYCIQIASARETLDADRPSTSLFSTHNTIDKVKGRKSYRYCIDKASAFFLPSLFLFFFFFTFLLPFNISIFPACYRENLSFQVVRYN